MNSKFYFKNGKSSRNKNHFSPHSKRVCLVNLGGACNAEDALKSAKMRAFLDSANGPGRR